jgi:GT2 family glycosyltransferase
LVVSYNCREYLRRCLSSIIVQGDRMAVETFVVDNASTDGSAAMVKGQFPWVALRENTENVGYVKANNQAIRESTGRHVLLLNPDAELFPKALERMIAFLDSNPRAGAVGVKTWSDSERTFQWGADKIITPALLLSQFSLWGRLTPRNPTLERLWSLDEEIFDCPDSREVETIDGDCLLVRKEAFADVGLLDESFFMYFEDLDLCRRLRRAGWSLHYLASAEVAHYAWKSSADRERAFRTFLGGLRPYLHRYYGWWKLQAVFAAMFTSFRADHMLNSLGGVKAVARRLLGRKSLPGGGRISAEQPSVSWPEVSGAFTYWLEVSYHPVFLYKGGRWVEGTSFAPPAFFLRDWEDGTYFLRVAPRLADGSRGRYYVFTVQKKSRPHSMVERETSPSDPSGTD